MAFNREKREFIHAAFLDEEITHRQKLNLLLNFLGKSLIISIFAGQILTYEFHPY